MNRDNTLLLNAVEDHLWPESEPARYALFPVLFPVGLAAVTLDAAILHPAAIIDDAARDTKEALWTGFEWEEKYVTECTALPWRAALSPLFFSFAFAGRSFFDLPERDEEALKKEKEGSVERARVLLNGGKPAQALALLDDPREVDDLLQEMLISPSPQIRWSAHLFRMLAGSAFPGNEVIRDAIRDPDPVVRHAALSWMEKRFRLQRLDPLRTVLEEALRVEEHPLNRAVLHRILERMKNEEL
jgi:hypothetical protein